MVEREYENREIPLSEEQMAHLAAIAERKERRAMMLGVQFSAHVEDMSITDHTKPIFTRNANDRREAMSINKLAVAKFAVDNIGATEAVRIQPDQSIAGPGHYDALELPVEVSVESLVDDMLRRSGNTAFSALVRAFGGASAVNGYLSSQGYGSTHLKQIDEGIFTGMTTPFESSRLMIAALHPRPFTMPRLGEVSADALLHNESRYGVRQKLTGDAGVELWNKTGEANRDSSTPYFIRNDVGVMAGPDGRELVYSFMTRTATRVQAMIANQMLGQLGAEFAAVLDPLARRRHTLGRLGVHAS